MSRPLGSAQASILRSLVQHKLWSTDRCGWIWGNRSTTVRLLDSLVARGLVSRTPHEVPLKNGLPQTWTARTYRPTAEGKAVAAAIRAERAARTP